jgi:hypothetical protein
MAMRPVATGSAAITLSESDFAPGGAFFQRSGPVSYHRLQTRDATDHLSEG